MLTNKTQAEENAELEVAAACWRGVGRSFRGEIYDYARTFTLGSGYLGDWSLTNLCRNCRAKGGVRTCRHFEIDTARHLIGPFKAILDQNVRIVMLLKAAQTGGSLVWDMTVHYLLVHSPYMRVKVLMDCEEKARSYCVQRLMETLRKNPDIAPLLPTGADRFGVTDTELRLLNGKTLFVGGLNETNASSLPADVMILDEGWIHQSDGLMGKAVNRVKQSQKRGKLIIVGQAGKVKEDQDLIWEGLHVRIPLTFSCPACGGRQEFNITKQRPADFISRPIMSRGEWTTPSEQPKPETFWGMKVPGRFSELDTPEKIKSAAAITTFECYHCGCELPDTREIREAINATFEQEYRPQLPDGTFYTPKNFSVGFWQPDPASMFVPWRNTMQAYIEAVKSKEELGNFQKLIDFYQANWATAWDEKLNSKQAERAGASIYEIGAEKLPGEIRISATDIQFRMTHMVYLAVSVGAGTPPLVLHFEWIKPPSGMTDAQMAEFCKNRVRELDKQLGIQVINSVKDVAHESGLVMEWAAEDAVWGKTHKRERAGWLSYELLRGDDRPSYLWKHEGRKPTWERFKEYHDYPIRCIKNGKPTLVTVHQRLWSNPSIKEIAERWRDGYNAPKLQIHEKFLRDTSKEGLWQQLNSEQKLPKKNNADKLVYQKLRPENHAWDCWAMIMVRMDVLNMLSSFGPPPEDKEGD